MSITFKFKYFSIIYFIFFGFNLNSWAQDFNDIAIAHEYYNNKETEKARSMYEQLIKKNENIPMVHSNYYNILLNENELDEAEKYINRLIRRNPQNMIYQVDLGRIYSRQNNKDKEESYFNSLIEDYKSDINRVRILAQYLLNHQLTDYAILAYKEGRKHASDPYLYALEMANVYRFTNNKQGMIEEFINYASQNASNLNYVQNLLQNLLNEEGDFEILESYLIDKVQENADSKIYNELLIWVNMQQKNFYGAFIQARAIDKRLKYNGSMVLDVGLIALENKDFENAIRIFEYVVKEYPQSMNYAIAKSMIIKSREEMIKNTFPIDQQEIRNLVEDYDQLIKEIGVNANTVQSLRNKALLHAFYLDEFERAIHILEQLTQLNGLGTMFKAQCKIDLGDIYLFIDQPWESTLLYSQVEKSQKETLIGYEAKLKNAKLNFYKGEFGLAQEHLDILKQATSREIANDAMALSSLIQDNTVMDTSGAALRDYADIELMLFRNKKQEGFDALSAMLVNYKNHSITDEVLLLRARLLRDFGRFTESIDDLSKILQKYAYDIYSDDAYFLTGKIYEEDLKDREKAMEIFQEFLKKYPGSVFVAEARSRFRKLRGDFNRVN